jgi:hypothetical protein
MVTQRAKDTKMDEIRLAVANSTEAVHVLILESLRRGLLSFGACYKIIFWNF